MALPLRNETWEGAQREARTCPPPTAEHTAAYGQPELACDTPRLPPERRRATGSTSGLDRALNYPSGRDPTVPRTAGRTNNGRSPDGSGGGRDSSASCRGCTSSFTCFAWRPTGAIGHARPVPRAPRGHWFRRQRGGPERRYLRAGTRGGRRGRRSWHCCCPARCSRAVRSRASGRVKRLWDAPGFANVPGGPSALAHDCARRTTPRTYSDFASAYSFPSLYRSARVCFSCSYRRASSGWLRR
jgi:hypothetical protein